MQLPPKDFTSYEQVLTVVEQAVAEMELVQQKLMGAQHASMVRIADILIRQSRDLTRLVYGNKFAVSFLRQAKILSTKTRNRVSEVNRKLRCMQLIFGKIRGIDPIPIDRFPTQTTTAAVFQEVKKKVRFAISTTPVKISPQQRHYQLIMRNAGRAPQIASDDESEPSMDESEPSMPSITELCFHANLVAYINNQNWLGESLKTLSINKWLMRISQIHYAVTHHAGSHSWAEPKCSIYRDHGLVVSKGRVNLNAERGTVMESLNIPFFLTDFVDAILLKLQENRGSIYELVKDPTLTPAQKRFLERHYILLPEPDLIHPKMRELCVITQTQLQEGVDPVAVAASFLVAGFSIQPWVRKCGTTFRFWMNLILMQGGYQPVTFPDRSAYFDAIKADDKIPGAFEYFLNSLVRV